MKNIVLLTAVMALLGVGEAKADLFDLTNPPGQSDTPISLSFVAGATTTDIVFGGYQVPSVMEATDISLTTGGGGNLLGLTWNFTPAASGSIADQFGNGSVNGLQFAGVVVGDFDEFDQEISTVIGQTYDINFLFTNSPFNAPSGFFVNATDALVATPEPGSLTLLALCISGAAILARKKLAR
jgi:hypothetical protein